MCAWVPQGQNESVRGCHKDDRCVRGCHKAKTFWPWGTHGQYWRGLAWSETWWWAEVRAEGYGWHVCYRRCAGYRWRAGYGWAPRVTVVLAAFPSRS
jgi:hypothetical protein